MGELSLSVKATTTTNPELTSIRKPVAAMLASIPELKDSCPTTK